MSSSIDGMASGLDTTTIISQLMQIERQGQNRLKSKQAAENSKISTYQTLNSRFAAIGSAADALTRASNWATTKATSSDTDRVSVTTGTGALPGRLTFKVSNLATSNSVRSNGTVASTASIVHQGPSMLVSAASGLGFASLATGAGLALGEHKLEVTQASAGAAVAGTANIQNGITLAAPVDLDVEVDGMPQSFQLAAGAYANPSAFAAAVEQASGGVLSARAAADGTVRLTTVAEGSAHSLQVTGGTNLAALGISVGGGAAVGTDGKVKVGDTETTLTDIRAGASATLSASSGSISATFAGGLRVGEAKANNVSVGDGSLASVVSAINGAQAGVTATAVQVGSNAYRLQLGSTATGASSGLSLATGELSGFGGFTTLTAGKDATLTVGTGPGAYEIKSANNAVTGVMPGVTINLLEVSEDDEVTVDVTRDGEGLADKVDKLVKAANDALSYVKDQSAYNVQNKSGGPLLGDGLSSRLVSRLRNDLSRLVSGTTLGSPGKAGLTLNSDGTVKFDRTKFLETYAKDPDSVAALFQQGGSASSSAAGISFSSASDTTREGSWAVNVTTAARQASSTGAEFVDGTLDADENIDLKVGSKTASYSARNGETLASIAAGLTAAASEQGLGLVAAVESNKLVVRTINYGAESTFQLRSSGTGSGLASAAGVWESAQTAGQDVAGTINGVAATGKGQFLTAPAADQTLAGLTLRITASAPISGQTFTYAPGLAQRLDTIVKDATDSVNGQITLAITGRKRSVTSLDEQIDSWDTRLTLREASLKRQFSNLEVALSKAKSQGSWLSGQLASLN